jgi:TonB family protein
MSFYKQTITQAVKNHFYWYFFGFLLFHIFFLLLKFSHSQMERPSIASENFQSSTMVRLITPRLPVYEKKQTNALTPPRTQTLSADHTLQPLMEKIDQPAHETANQEKIIDNSFQETQLSPSYFVQPHYPLSARKRGLQGLVVLKLLVNYSGEVEVIELLESSGHSLLDESAMEAVKKWMFPKTTTISLGSKQWIRKTIEFKLI